MSAVKRLYRMVPMICVMGTIFFLSHQPGDTLDVLSFDYSDKLLHFLAYGVLGICVMYGLANPGGRDKALQLVVIAVVISTCYGISDEYHQSFIDGRYPSFNDIIADFSGALVFCLSCMKLNFIYDGVAPLR